MGARFEKMILPVGTIFVLQESNPICVRFLLPTATYTSFAVSYTHLDVYKRQALKGIFFLVWRLRSGTTAGDERRRLFIQNDCSTEGPISYTHLYDGKGKAEKRTGQFTAAG